MLYEVKSCADYQSFIEHCRKALLNYKKNIYCIVFLERLRELVQASQYRHQQHCTDAERSECRFNKFYKVVLFYLKNELDYQEKDLPFVYFKRQERRELEQNIEDMMDQMPTLQGIDRRNFMKLRLELNEMKSYNFLDKKNWKQLFLGKVKTLENSRILTPDQGSTLLKTIEERFA